MRILNTAASAVLLCAMAGNALAVTASGDEVDIAQTAETLIELNEETGAETVAEEVPTVPIPAPLAFLMTACLGLIVAAGRDA
ncbi:MAG: hypothetical protein AAFR17_19180 [Pseudomonadota bacterium]